MAARPMPRRLEYMPLSDIPDAPANPKGHALDLIEESIDAHGYVEAVAIDERTGLLVAGHGRKKALLARLERGEDPPDGIIVRRDGTWLVPVQRGWSSEDDEQARRYLFASNQGTIAGGWLERELAPLLNDLADTPAGLTGTGFTDDDLAALNEMVGDDEGSERANGTGTMLSVIDVTYGEPTHQVKHGDVWHLGQHVLIVAQLAHEHALWREHLVDGVTFAPYPEPYITTSTAGDAPLLLVQPNPFLAGHLLDKHASAFPDDRIARVSP